MTPYSTDGPRRELILDAHLFLPVHSSPSQAPPDKRLRRTRRPASSGDSTLARKQKRRLHPSGASRINFEALPRSVQFKL
eukprot:7814974-Alexandrium_andersonii.AAC.1